MKKHFAAFAAGVLFAVGLAISGMTKPSKIIGFLDLGGAWDPSLAFVMGGALLVHVIAFRIITKRRSPLFDGHFHLPVTRTVDLPLVVGAAIFGVGWGLGGFCPGPAIVSAASGMKSALIFFAAMLLGVAIERLVRRTRSVD